VLRRQWWSPTIGDAPCRSKGERQESEGCGLGEERLGGWLAEEREQSGGADQILTDDGAPVLRRVTGNVSSGRWHLSPVARAWTIGERGETGTGRRPTLLKSDSVVWGQKEKGKGALRARPCGGGRRRRGGPWRGGGQLGWPTMAPDHQVWAVTLPREQGRAARVGDAGDGV
jgi:hypothetical protein